MPDLLQALQGHDLGFLKIIAEAWGIPLNAPDAHTALPVLVAALTDRSLAGEVIEALPDEAKAALEVLLENEGRMPWAAFSRRFGEVRTFGQARRDRERPDLTPISPAEVLWYRAFIAKAFLYYPPEPQEFAYIPDNLIDYLEPLSHRRPRLPGRAASPGESAQTFPANDRILDHSCSLLAALRTGRDPTKFDSGGWQARLPFLTALLKAAGVIDGKGKLHPDAVRNFLAARRGEALAMLVNTWVGSGEINELLCLPGLVFEGKWQNNPLHTRQAVLTLIEGLPEEPWWSLPAFIAAIRDQYPDYQRPAGDYDSWFIRKENSDSYLRGFSSWDEVDGALLRFFITGPLHWLGILDLASAGNGSAPTAFRRSAWAAGLLAGKPPQLAREQDALEAFPDGHLKLGLLTPRVVRYQIARFCEWEPGDGKSYLYRVTPTSLANARKQGLLPSHLLMILQRASHRPAPPALLQAIERWDKFGVQAGIQKATLLRVSSPEALEALQKSRAGRFIAEILNPTTALLRHGNEEAVRKALAEAGYLSDSSLEPENRS